MANSSDDLDDEERELLRQHRESKQQNDDSDEVTIGKPDGSTFTGTFRRALQLGLVSLPEAKPEGDAGGKGGQVKRFTGGRRTG